MKKGPIIALVAVLLTASVVTAVYRWVYSPGTFNGSGVKVVISPGSSAGAIATQLEDSKVVRSALAFRIFLKLQSVSTALKAGEYQLREGMSYKALLDKLRKGPEVRFIKLTIPEGLTLDQTAQRVADKTHIKKEEFLQAAVPLTLAPKDLDVPITTLEGFLYPKTYFVTEKETGPELVKRLVQQFDKETSALPWDSAKALGLNRLQVVIVASLIEQEAKVASERPLIASVIYNRLRKGMKLEIDATVQYVVGKYGGQLLTESDLNVDSPYNTRRFAGLPPGPIGSPQVASIVAALSPAQSDSLYYALSADCKTHLFTANYNEFLRAKAQIPTNC